MHLFANALHMSAYVCICLFIQYICLHTPAYVCIYLACVYTCDNAYDCRSCICNDNSLLMPCMHYAYVCLYHAYDCISLHISCICLHISALIFLHMRCICLAYFHLNSAYICICVAAYALHIPTYYSVSLHINLGITCSPDAHICVSIAFPVIPESLCQQTFDQLQPTQSTVGHRSAKTSGVPQVANLKA